MKHVDRPSVSCETHTQSECDLLKERLIVLSAAGVDCTRVCEQPVRTEAHSVGQKAGELFRF